MASRFVRWFWPVAPPTLWRPAIAALYPLVVTILVRRFGPVPVALGVLTAAVVFWTGWVRWREYDATPEEERFTRMAPPVLPALAAAVLVLLGIAEIRNGSDSGPLTLTVGIATALLAAGLWAYGRVRATARPR